MAGNYFAAFDSETGGLNEKEADLLTWYMAILDEDYKILDELYLKLKPDNNRLPVAEFGALRVNGINLQKHMEDPETLTYSQGRAALTAMVKKYHKKVGKYNNIRPLGYNVPFDENWTFEHLMPKKEWLNLFHYKRIDVMERVDFLKEVGWFPQDIGSLNTVVDYLQLPKRAAHNCREDTLMTVDVYKKLLEIMKAKKENGGVQDLISILEAE